MRLTPKQEAFARKYVETSNAAEAYRFAYNTANMAATTIYPRASELLSNSKVAVRVAELQAEYLADTDVSARDVVRGLHSIATDPDAPHSARVSAWLGLAKRHPEFSDKHEVTSNVRLQALQAVASMSEEQLLRLAEGTE